MGKTYAEKLKDPLWLMKRSEIINRDNSTCQSCGDKDGVMDVHHEYYLPNAEPWQYPNKALVTLCHGCHSVEENGRKQAYLHFNRAIADAGFTREDIVKLTTVFKEITVLPVYSYILTSAIFMAISESWQKFEAPIYEGINEKEPQY